MAKFVLEEYGQELQDVINKVQQLVAEGGPDATLFTAEERKKLDLLGIEYNDTAYWDEQIGYIPEAGVIIIYSDYDHYEKDGQTIYVPGLKVGSGNAYVQDLAFIGGSNSQVIEDHIHNLDIHVTPEDKAFWNSKLNCEEINDELLVFNRN